MRKPGVRVYETKPTTVIPVSVKHLAESVLSAENALPGGTLSVILVDHTEIKRLNARFLKRNRVTDVIAFPMGDAPDGHASSDPCIGEVYISTDQAARQAREYRVSMEDELSRLVVHGILHLCGYDDGNRKRKDEMKKREDWHLARGKRVRMKRKDDR